MVKIGKVTLGLYLFPLWIILLASCSPSQELEASPSMTMSQTQPATVTSQADVSTRTVPETTSTKALSPSETAVQEDETFPTQTPSEGAGDSTFADVLSVAVSGSENDYRFSVEIRSPDTGCEQYADWWEVITPEGELLYRRILTHSHVSEQPFTRSGGPVSIEPDTIVIVRAHMYPGGYGGTAFQGSFITGFEAFQILPDFAGDLDEVDPLPSGCGF